MPSYDEELYAHAPVEPCELPDDIQLVYVDARDRRRTVAIDDAAGIDFDVAKAFRKPPAYRANATSPGGGGLLQHGRMSCTSPGWSAITSSRRTVTPGSSPSRDSRSS